MKDPYKRRYFYLMMSIFGAISLSILVFYLLYRFQGVGNVFHKLKDILALQIAHRVSAALFVVLLVALFVHKLIVNRKANP